MEEKFDEDMRKGFKEDTRKKSQEPKDNESITEESILEAEIESLGMQLDDLRKWFSAILGKDNLRMTMEGKKKMTEETRNDLNAIRTKFFNKTELGKK